jgi:hypothetical protein
MSEMVVYETGAEGPDLEEMKAKQRKLILGS